ncbi:MAG: nucleoside triphosphate pyrophosphohydrolase [Coriobacteriaceae bacterium]|nr:nucleoside triphosphate pyrophosphohydrolase [Coriobacteriaceae bacterium]
MTTCNVTGGNPSGDECLGSKLERFAALVAALRAPDGCPWDREQTHQSIASHMIEETYEAVAAIERGDIANLREELGDMLLQIVLQSQIAKESGEFTFADVVDDIDAKIVRRHPHVFGDEAAFAAARFSKEQIAQIQQAQTAGEVINLWDQIKLHEKAMKASRCQGETERVGLLDNIPQSFPALMQAQDISRKVVASGFEWETIDEVWEQFESEVDEFNATELGSIQAEQEFGDMLFTLVNVARKQGIDAESALRSSCRKIRERWAIMEQYAQERDQRLEELGTVELEAMWQKAKLRENGSKDGSRG